MSPEALRCTRWAVLGRYGVDRTLAPGPRPCVDSAVMGVKRVAAGAGRYCAGLAAEWVETPTDLVFRRIER